MKLEIRPAKVADFEELFPLITSSERSMRVFYAAEFKPLRKKIKKVK